MRCEGAARSGEQVEGEAGERREGSRKGKQADKLKGHINYLEKMEADYKRYVPLHLLLLPLFTYCCVRLQGALMLTSMSRIHAGIISLLSPLSL